MDAFEASLAQSLNQPQITGPSPDTQFSLDFQPYLKTSDRQYHISDWATKQRGRQQNNTSAGGFAFKADENDGGAGGFTSGDKGGAQKSRQYLKPMGQRQAGTGGPRVAGKKPVRPAPGQRREYNNNNRNGNNRYGNNNRYNNNRSYFRREEIQRGYSCSIPPHWEQIARFPLTNPNGSSLPRLTTLKQVGVVDAISSDYCYVNTRSMKPIQVQEQFSTQQIPLEQDPHIQELLKDEDNLGESMTFVLTDNVAAMFMNVQHTVQPWDVAVKITENNVAYITTPNPNNIVNQHLVDESQLDRLPQETDNVNSVLSLATEATALSNNLNYLFQERGAEPLTLEAPLPTEDNNGTPLFTAYTYRRFFIEDIAVIVRAPIHCHQRGKQDSFIHVATVFEYDSSSPGGYHVDFRKNVDSMLASTFSSELKCNSAYMHRVLCQAILSGADEIKLAWASRQNAKQPGKHTLVSVTSHPIQQFLNLVQFRKTDYFDQLSNVLVELVLDPGNYTLLREPNERSLSVYNTSAPEKTE